MPHEVPIEAELDLHAFAPRDVGSVVDEYITAAHTMGLGRVRLVHGRGSGVQRSIVQAHLEAGRISQEFYEIETSHDPEHHLPFMPSRVEDLTSWMAFAGLAVSCPVQVLGSALLLGVKAEP